MEIREPIVNILLLTFLLVLFLPCSIKAQETIPQTSGKVAEVFKIAESKYPVNDEYVNGTKYAMPNSGISGHPYFNSNSWMMGTIFVGGKEFGQLQLKYDLVLDELILLFKNGTNAGILIAVNKSQIDSFYIAGQCFVNVGNLDVQQSAGYFQKVYEGELSVYRKFNKTFIGMYNRTTPEGKFSSSKNEIYLLHNRQLANIDNKKSLLGSFPRQHKNEIGKFLKANSIKYKHISDSQLVKLMGCCETLILGQK